MSAEDWEAWCDATAVLDDEPPPGSGWDDEDGDPGLAGGERVAWPAGFGKGGDADGLPGGAELAFLADAAAGADDRYAGATDGELDGVIAAWDRVEAHPSARKHLAIAEFIRRRPEKGCAPAEPAKAVMDVAPDKAWTCCRPGPTWTCCWPIRTPGRSTGRTATCRSPGISAAS